MFILTFFEKIIEKLWIENEYKEKVFKISLFNYTGMEDILEKRK